MIKLLLIAFFVVFACLPSCAQTEYKKFKDDSEVPRVSLADAKKDFDSGSVVIVDARSPEIFKQEHITGATNIPIGSSEHEFDKLPKGKKIIVYCS